MKSTAIIVGGGVIGLSTAYHLSRKRFGKVILLDKGPIGDGASSRAAGNVQNLVWHREGVQTRLKGVELYRQLSEELDGYQYHNVGCFNLWDRETWEKKQTLLPMYDEVGAAYEVFDGEEIHRRWPALQALPEVVALHDPNGGYSEPHEYLPALANRIQQLGVDIREHQKVTGFLQRGGRISGVTTTMGEVEADAVICTVHVWAVALLKQIGLSLPLKSFVHQRFLTTPVSWPVEFPVVGAYAFNESYMRPAFGNRILVGVSTNHRREYPVRSTDFHMSMLSCPDEVLHQRRSELTPLLPQLADVTWEDQKVGLLCYSADYEPVLGPLAELPGMFVATAFHSSGFAYNPIAGLLLAEYVADGKTSINVNLFRPDRFDEKTAEKFVSSSLTQSDIVSRRH